MVNIAIPSLFNCTGRCLR